MKFDKFQRSCVFLSVDSFWNFLGIAKEDMLVTVLDVAPLPGCNTVESVKVNSNPLT